MRFPSLSLAVPGFLALAALSLAPAANAQVTISTAPTGNIGSWGTPDSGSTPTYAQVITDPAGNPYLQSVTYNINNPNLSAIPFQASVYAWNGTTITGSALYTSGALSVAPTANVYAPVTVSGINTQLTPGSQYAVLYSTLGYTGGLGSARFLTAPGAAYAGGLFEFNNAGTSAGLSSGWSSFGNNLAFSMTFTPTSSTTPPVPEPGSVATLVGLGVSGVGFLARRRRQARK